MCGAVYIAYHAQKCRLKEQTVVVVEPAVKVHQLLCLDQIHAKTDLVVGKGVLVAKHLLQPRVHNRLDV